MKLVFEKRFENDLKKVKDKHVLQELKEIIQKIFSIKSLLELDKNIKRMRSNPNYWRIKIGDYRVGLEKDKDKVIFVRILHRKDIYKYFP